jgi:hypothetical protein
MSMNDKKMADIEPVCKTISVGTVGTDEIRLEWGQVEGHEYLKRAIEVALVGGHPVAVLSNRHSCAGELIRRANEVAKERGIPFRAIVHPVCPCGNYGSPCDECNCSFAAIKNSLKKIAKRKSEFHIWVESIARAPTGRDVHNEALDAVMTRVERARKREPLPFSEAETSSLVSAYCQECRPTQIEIEISKRVADSAARLESGSNEVGLVHIAEAFQYSSSTCPMIRNWMEIEGVEEQQKNTEVSAIDINNTDMTPIELVDSAYELVFIYKPQSLAQETWRRKWLRNAKLYGAGLDA